MRTYPCYLRSKESGNLYFFEGRGYECTFIETSRNHSQYRSGQKVVIGYTSEDKFLWTEESPYDPTQVGDTEDDI